MWILKNSVTAHLFEASPFKVHQSVYHECILNRGGFFATAVPPVDILRRFLSGQAVGIAAHDLMPAFRHLFGMGKEVFFSSYAGYYYSLKLPVKGELDRALRTMLESGVMHKVGAWLGQFLNLF